MTLLLLMQHSRVLPFLFTIHVVAMGILFQKCFHESFLIIHSDVLRQVFCTFPRCFCSNCSPDLTTKAEECQCCQEIDRCGEVMEQFGDHERCITLHPGFQDVCLNKQVLEVAALSLKTKAGKSYRTMFVQGRRTESE